MIDSTLLSAPVSGAKIIDGRAHAMRLRAGYRRQVDALRLQGVSPSLAVILVGTDAPSAVYVRNKVLACQEVGINSTVVEEPSSITLERMVKLIDSLNADPKIHGILIQLPLPPQIPLNSVLQRIAPDKDVDGFHLYNVGGLVVGSTVFSPCTPFGVRQLLEAEDSTVEGQNVVVVGASNIVGKPTALMLMQQDATVCICHAKTRDLAQFTILADLLGTWTSRPSEPELPIHNTIVAATRFSSGAAIVLAPKAH